MTTSKRLTPGQHTAMVLYVAAAAMAAMAVALMIASANNLIIISGQWHFGLVVTSLLVGVIASTIGAAANDRMFVWPEGGTHDPPPRTLLPSIHWQRSTKATMWIWRVNAGVLAGLAAALMVCTVSTPREIVFSYEFHFTTVVVLQLLAAFFMFRAASVEDRGKSEAKGRFIASWIFTVAMVADFASVFIAAGNGHILFTPEFDFGVCALTLALGSISLFAAGRAADRGKTDRAMTTLHVYIIAGALAVEAGIAAAVGTKTVLFTPVFHILLVVALLLLAGGAGVFAALLRDRDCS